MDLPTAVAVATSVAALIGAPSAAWAAYRPALPLADDVRRDVADATVEGHLTAVAWNIPPRNVAFTGRREQLAALRGHLQNMGPVVIMALHGMGGVGKSSLAVEYAHRFAEDYDIAWWIDAEQPAFVAEQLVSLGSLVGWTPNLSDVSAGATEVLRRLRVENRWLVVLDNVESPEEVARWLPQGPGHVLLTSRRPDWWQLAAAVEVDVFDRDESIALLRRISPAVSGADAGDIAREVGDLPLAVAQAAGVLSETGISARDYLKELRRGAAAVMAEGKPLSYPTSFAAAIKLSLGRMADDNAAAAQLVRLCSAFAAEPIPIELFSSEAAARLPQPLGPATVSAMDFRRVLGRVNRFGLAKVNESTMQLHRLTIMVVADQLDAHESSAVHASAQSLVAAATPGDSRHPESWPAWSRLMPHLLALEPANSENPSFRAAAWQGAWFLLERGELSLGRSITEDLYLRWRDRLGSDDTDTMHAAHGLASAHWRLGQHDRAEAISRDTYLRRRRLYGEDHADTLLSAVQYAWQLYEVGRFAEAYELNEDAVARLRRCKGMDSRLTLGATHNLAIMLRKLGDIEAAIALDEDTHGRRLRLLGKRHPHTLISVLTLVRLYRQAGQGIKAMEMCNEALATSRATLGVGHYITHDLAALKGVLLYDAGRLQEAQQVQQDTLDRRIEVLGAAHPHTVETAKDLARTLRALKKSRLAVQIEAKFPSSG
ncbi:MULTISPECIES: FxSxx-COOH system tetratricopeptide repeat protein [Catenuloplanes]|uniref:Tetratricopeptide (TPR) repeat protein n=1 Tax=Catenuloplanes niger TaxID=587534 RepID=A0AAE3ZJC7_9ACTN|nr:FxSxx-COOH system tetratricopeptide repeat protein [Catenuloplanes niger]MDR7320958.1 tetratricopeptide (TPR) repeat protein [Catenuloplanes niger]